MCSLLKNSVAPVFYKFHYITLTPSESIHQELTDSERRAKDAMLLQVRRCLCLCNTRNMLVGGVLVSAEHFALSHSTKNISVAEDFLWKMKWDSPPVVCGCESLSNCLTRFSERTPTSNWSRCRSWAWRRSGRGWWRWRWLNILLNALSGCMCEKRWFASVCSVHIDHYESSL